jgi:hypothetical protein
MTRRKATLLISSGLTLQAETKPPCLTDDLVKLNAFADVYNEYVEKLQRNIHDLKAANAVIKKWPTLINAEK